MSKRKKPFPPDRALGERVIWSMVAENGGTPKENKRIITQRGYDAQYREERARKGKL